jgi:hypothetical protein
MSFHRFFFTSPDACVCMLQKAGLIIYGAIESKKKFSTTEIIDNNFALG